MTVPTLTNPAILALPQSNLPLAEMIAAQVQGELILCNGDEQPKLQTLLPALFAQSRPIIGLCASAILIRILAPHLESKTQEPPVLAVSNDAEHVVPLLGGHHGANRLAKDIALFLDTKAAITTASESYFGFALDNPPAGYVCGNRDRAKAVMARAIKGDMLKVFGPSAWLDEAGYVFEETQDQAEADIIISTQTITHETALIFHPKLLVAGMGCARGTSGAEVIEHIENRLTQAKLSTQSLAAIASIDVKADETGLHQAANHFGVPLRVFSAQDLSAESVPNPSVVVQEEVGTPSVSEAAAQKAGALVLEKTKTKNVTLAVGEAHIGFDPYAFGRGQGSVHLVGIGPGEIGQRTASATQALRQSSDWVGYEFYLDLVADLHADQHQHRFGLGDEEPRVRLALELAGQGKNVALICSGDAQIYAMGALVFELLHAQGDRAVSAAAQRVEVVSHPGISAFQMASARAGALIGHDFCCISLSDLLTPRDDILMRLDAAAQGDFVTAFYNPRSLRRTDLLGIAQEKFLAHRPQSTPVIVARQLGRPEEDVRVTNLGEFDPQSIDMMTIVLFGSSQSKSLERGDGKTYTFTPRGYAKKAQSTQETQ